MDTRKFTGKLSAIAISILLASCGGGDGYYGNNGSTDSSSGTGTGTDTKQAVNVSTISLFDTNNAESLSITASGVTAKVKVIDKAGQGISGALVTFSGTGVVFGTSNGAVLTNADGEASIAVKPEDLNATGAYQITATAEFNGVTATSTPKSFALQAANIVLVGLAAANTTLNSGASTNITLKTQDANSKANQNNVSVNFNANCGTFEPATVVSSNQGDVTAAYKAISADGKLCDGTVTITASGSGITAQSITVNVAEIMANSLVYASDATNLGIKSSGSSASGQVEFILYADKNPVANKEVNIELLRAPEGLTFQTLGNTAPQTVKSGPDGKIIVNLYPGDKPGPIEIKAALKANTNVFALSRDLAVATGRVSQDHLSLSASKNSLQGDKDGDTASITASMADRNGNPVPNGTTISFIAEGGSITPNCSTVNGICSVTLRTQNPRPLDNRVSVLAYVEGDKSFIDVDGDNVYTEKDTLNNNIGDFFRDDNEDNLYNASLGEFIYKRSAGNLACTLSSIGQPNIVDTCDNKLDAVLRKQMLFAFASDTPTFFGVSGVDQSMSKISNFTNFSFKVFGNSARQIPMPSGTTVSVSARDNSEFKPIAQLIDAKDSNNVAIKQILVSSAEPNTTAQVKLGDSFYFVTIGANGVGTYNVPNNTTGALEVSYTNTSCEAEIISGSLEVPGIMSLFTPTSFKDVSADVAYSVKMKGCAVSDDIKITITAPNKITTKTITL
ncbi:Ig-like domain-containing protein [Acinetobacter wuhouensis]|uniref:Big-1 domain-containing protein n=1 Tax=Acinetobacter wuhouensis TaxID=1879050 RepID=A0A3G2SZT3_9GAMM|nr:hypothetical protein [Acinetobacter wuhouensis]AYO53186.1 hypothetical protein CDG68_05695 [Acinetobacter wuhouensis]